MTRRIFLAVMAPLLLGAASASAGGINLGWNDCPSGASYSFIETFACDTNTGSNVLVGSFVAPVGADSVTANEIVIDLQTRNATLSPWWSLRSTAPAGCRSAMSQSADFSANSACTDYWQLNALGGVSQDPPVDNRARIKVLEALPSRSPFIMPIPEGTEIYSFKVTITNAKTVGPGACTGCSDEACIVLSMIRLVQVLPLSPIVISSPAASQFVLWQGWTNSNPNDTCPGTPARQQTWGAIKALYR